MEQPFQKFQWKEDAMNFHSLSLFPQVRAPSKFKMPSLDKFDGIGCPKAHLKMYKRALQSLGAIKEILAQMFQNTLIGAALRWFLNLEDSLICTWEDIGNEFYKQYKCNTKVDITRCDLEQPSKSPRKLSQSLSQDGGQK